LKQYDFYDSKLIIILAYRKLLCEGEIGSIKCGKDQKIRIIRGSYGRSDSATCWTGTGDAGKCTGKNVLLTMYESCSGKQSCDLSASDSVFGNACSNASSYLDVEYFCEGMTSYIKVIRCRRCTPALHVYLDIPNCTVWNSSIHNILYSFPVVD
jgi:hypothetical protein